MSGVSLSDKLFAEMAGWEVMKQARGLLAAGRVQSSDWQPPILRGTVIVGESSQRAGLVINSSSDVENLCPCRDSKQRGIICAHAVAVGLHHLKSLAPVAAAPAAKSGPSALANPPSPKPGKTLRRAAVAADGEPLEVFVILPPNVVDAAARGKMMIYLEGKWRGGRAPLNALPATATFALEPEDQALVTALEDLGDGETPAMLMLSTQQLADLLPKLVGHPRVSIGKTQTVSVISDPLPLLVQASLEANGEILLKLAKALPPGTIRGKDLWVFDGKQFQPIGLPHSLSDLIVGSLRIPRSRVPAFLNVEWPALVARCEVQSNFALDDFTLEMAEPRFKLHLAGGSAQLRARLECFYGERPVNSLASDNLWLPETGAPTVYRTRNFSAEQAALGRLLKSGFAGPDSEGLYHLKGQNLVLNFFAREYPRLEKEWRVTLEERLEHSTRENMERIHPRFQIASSGEQWFDLNISYDTAGGEKLSPTDIQRLLLSGQSHTRLRNGKFALLDTEAVAELQEVLVDCAPQQQGGSYRFDQTQAGFLDASLRQQTSWPVQAPTAWAQRVAQQRGENKPTPVALGELEAVLRPYQKEGVAWLQFLRANGFGGILADEMGLGKTLQVLALLNGLKSQRELSAPVLVVCPTSLVFNWEAEAAKFTPKLRVLVLHGAERLARFPQVAQHDLVITSYALLRRDAEQYRATEFDTVVLDEAQHIKNRDTQNAQAVKSIRARHRLVLTGTPLENSVLDLWSIFDFLMPRYLGAATDFRERYELPITRDQNLEVQQRLVRRVRPFLLRRLKREVAGDLPAKLEQVSYCELNEEQGAVYRQVLEASRREIVNAVDANGLAKTRMLVLTTLLRLRQICCDLRLLKLNLPDSEATGVAKPSGKVELFGELLEEVLDGGHRVLVFSQFTSMLALLSEELSARKLEFCYLDGATKDRAGVVEKFQRDQRISIFLISLKAGGVGLNLTGADTVVHFDPWWNPAVEAQATDRAHRIGQKKVVTSYKLITRGTVEEKILNLQARKRALLQGVLGEEEQLVASLNWEEIQDLLKE